MPTTPKKTRESPVNLAHRAAIEGSWLNRLALFITRHVGTMGFFLLIFGWTTIWLAWNLLAPRPLRFDPGPAFVFWLFISNMIQIFLMPLLMVGQNLQAEHAELRAEYDHQVLTELSREVKELKALFMEGRASPPG